MIVRCINNDGAEPYLTLGKLYDEVQPEFRMDGFITVEKDDGGEQHDYYTFRFERISE